VEDRGEDRPLHRELEGARGQQPVDDGLDAGLLPKPAEQQGRADAPAGEPGGVARLDRRQHQRPLGEAGDGGGEPVERAAGEHGVLAAEVLDDPLPGARALADALDEVEVGGAVDRLLAHEQARLAARDGGVCQAIRDFCLHYLVVHPASQAV
jgi:hypothetical protein